MRSWKLVLFSIAGTALLAACAGDNTERREIVLAPASEMPPELSAYPDVLEAYQFAVANPDLVSQYPCFCGCSALGHANNYECYVQDILADGTIIFESHAAT